MKFLADENFSKPLVEKIRQAGHSVKTVQQKSLQGSSDEAVTNIASKDRLIILTFDKDFLKKKSKTSLTVVFKFSRTPTQEIISLIDKFLQQLNRRKRSKIKILTFSKSGLHGTKSEL
jgi:predicted nuclease of predicted toxin-antitoxin system